MWFDVYRVHADMFISVALSALRVCQRGSEHSSVHLKFLCSAMRMTSMERAPYALITCLATGAPWSEQRAGMSFDDFMQSAFGSSVDGVPSQEQDLEFSCAHPSRNGSNCLLKGSDACDYPEAKETPRVIISVRGLWRPDDGMPFLRSPLTDKSPAVGVKLQRYTGVSVMSFKYMRVLYSRGDVACGTECMLIRSSPSPCQLPEFASVEVSIALSKGKYCVRP